jgi:hypothetical protein
VVRILILKTVYFTLNTRNIHTQKKIGFCLKGKVLLLFASFSAAWSFGQMLTNHHGEVFTDEPFFDQEFIRSHKIKSINGRYTYKPPGKPLKETNYWQVYEFDTLGRISQWWDTKPEDGSRDTVFHKYVYNGKGLLIYKSVGDSRIMTYESFMFDSLRRISSIESFYQYRNYDNVVTTRIQRKEYFTYELMGMDTVKVTMNSYQLPYLKMTTEYDSVGKVVKVDERFITTNEGTMTTFDYNKKGKLRAKNVRSTKEENFKERLCFVYDDKNNIKEKKVFKYETMVHETQFIFNESTNFLSAILTQENGSNFITILRIKEYEYYFTPEESQEVESEPKSE